MKIICLCNAENLIAAIGGLVDSAPGLSYTRFSDSGDFLRSGEGARNVNYTTRIPEARRLRRLRIR